MNSSIFKINKIFYAKIIFATLAFLTISQGVLFGQEKLKMSINTGVSKQQISIVGGDMERSQSALQSAKNKEDVVQWCFKDIAFNVCRVSYDKKQEMLEGTKNTSFYDRAIKSMLMIKEANPDIAFWATMKSDYNGYESSNNLPDWICDYRPTTRFDCKKYAVFLADYLELMEKNGVRIEYLSTAKEWTQVVTAQRAKEIILHLNKECKARGITQPKYVDAATWSVAQGVQYLKSVNKLSFGNLYWGCATHNYNSEGKREYEKFVEQANKLKLPAFAEESGTGSAGRTSGKEPETLDNLLRVYSEKCEFYRDGMAGEVLFEIFSRGVNSETRAVYFPFKGKAYRMRSYYVMKEFVNSLVGGKYYTPHIITGKGASDVEAMSFKSKDKLFFCVINNGEEAFSVQVSIDGKAKCVSEFTMRSFDANAPIEGVESKGKMGINNRYLKLYLTPKSIQFVNIGLR